MKVSSNSGARIGLAEDVSKVFRVKFKVRESLSCLEVFSDIGQLSYVIRTITFPSQDPKRPEEGFDHLFIESADEASVKDQSVYERMPNQTLKLKAVVGRPVSPLRQMGALTG